MTSEPRPAGQVGPGDAGQARRRRPPGRRARSGCSPRARWPARPGGAGRRGSAASCAAAGSRPCSGSDVGVEPAQPAGDRRRSRRRRAGRPARRRSVSASARRTVAATCVEQPGVDPGPCGGSTGRARRAPDDVDVVQRAGGLDHRGRRRRAEQRGQPLAPARSPTWPAAAGPGAARPGRRGRRPAPGRCRAAARGTRRGRRRRPRPARGRPAAGGRSSPVVTTSTRVAALRRLSPRTLYPTRPPDRARRAARPSAGRRPGRPPDAARPRRSARQRAGQGERDERRLAGAGRGHQHGGAGARPARPQRGQRGADRQVGPGRPGGGSTGPVCSPSGRQHRHAGTDLPPRDQQQGGVAARS